MKILTINKFYNHKWEDVSVEQFIGRIDEYINWYAENGNKMSLGEEPNGIHEETGLSGVVDPRKRLRHPWVITLCKIE